MTKVRKLKVTEQTRINGRSYGRSIVKRSPKINIAGDWLKKAGFNIGNAVEIFVADSFIQIIKPERTGLEHLMRERKEEGL